MSDWCARFIARPILRHQFSRLILFVASAACLQAAAQPQPRPKHELWRISVDGTGLRQLAVKPGFVCGSPDWSPDGKWIAFDTQRHEESLQAGQIAVIRPDGSELRHLGPGAMPSWSPDGRQIVCHTYGIPRNESAGIYVMNADGSGREQILDHWGGPRWMPRGNRIASVDGRGRLLLLDLETAIERNVFPVKYECRAGFAISPDGRRFSFGNGRSGAGIATLDDRTMQASVRTFLPAGSCNYSSWSPDGKRIVYSWHLDESTPLQLYLFEVESDKPPTRLPGQDESRINGWPDWSPDGETIIFSSAPFRPGS